MFDDSKIDPKIIEAIDKYASSHLISKRFILALILTESGFNPHAFRYEPVYIWVYSCKEVATALHITKDSATVMQKCSYGLCQIMGAVFHEYLGIIPQAQMYDIDTNIKCCCKYLEILANRKGIDCEKEPEKLYDIFNSGKIDDTDGNQKNVDRFMSNYLLF